MLRFIRRGIDSPSVAEDLQKLEAELRQLQAEKTNGADSIAGGRDSVRGGNPAIGSRIRRKSGVGEPEFAKRCAAWSRTSSCFPIVLRWQGFVLRGTARLQLANLLPDPRLRDTLRAPLERVEPGPL